jgi:hypothetical protein
MAFTFKFRRGPASEWTSDNPVLADGEPGLETNTGRLKIGNGSSTWTALPYFINQVDTQVLIDEAVDGITPGGSTPVKFWDGSAYEDVTGTIYLGGVTDPKTTVGDIWIEDDGTVTFYSPPPPEPPDAVTFTVTRATSGSFAPVIQRAVGSSATVQWLDEDDNVLSTSLTPSISLATGAHEIRMTCSAFEDIITVNLGYSHTQDAGELANAAYNHASQYVTAVQGLTHLTGLERFLCANTIGGGYTGNLAGALDFTGLADLIQIECYNALVSSVNLTGCSSLRRLCLEACNLTTLNINPVRLTLQDVRAAVQKTGALSFSAMTLSFPELWHFCVRDQPLTNALPLNLAPKMSQYWAWNCGLTTAAVPNSTDATSFLLYQNSFNQASVDNILVGLQTNSLANDGIVQLTDSAIPSSTGIAAAAALESGGWTVEVEEATGPVLLWSDTFNRANATGYVAVGNGWLVDGGGNINIVSNALRRTGGGYNVFYNPTNVTLPADLRIEMDVILSSGQGASFDYFGVALKYDPSSGDGIKVLLNPWNASAAADLNVGTSADPFSSETVTLDVSLPRSGWTTVGTRTLALEVVGSLCRVYFDGALIAHTTYTPSSPGVNIGIVGDPGTADAVIDAIRVYSV